MSSDAVALLRINEILEEKKEEKPKNKKEWYIKWLKNINKLPMTFYLLSLCKQILNGIFT